MPALILMVGTYISGVPVLNIKYQLVLNSCLTPVIPDSQFKCCVISVLYIDWKFEFLKLVTI